MSSTAEATWAAHLPDEIAHWRLWLRTRGAFDKSEREFADRFDPIRPLQEELRRLLPSEGLVRILDVGAGPCTTIGKVWPGHVVRLEAIDPLAMAYAELLGECGLIPPLVTVPMAAEDLLGHVPPDVFDMTHARNSLDHGRNPVAAVRAMLAITKPGGVVYLSHAIREADRQEHRGLHRWNFYLEHAALHVEGHGLDVNVTELLADAATCTVEAEEPGTWCIVTLRKKATP